MAAAVALPHVVELIDFYRKKQEDLEFPWRILAATISTIVAVATAIFANVALPFATFLGISVAPVLGIATGLSLFTVGLLLINKHVNQDNQRVIDALNAPGFYASASRAGDPAALADAPAIIRTFEAWKRNRRDVT